MASSRNELTGVAAIVLVGGLSSRMGTDKASLVVDGVSMLDRVRGAVADAGINRVAVAGTAALPDPSTGNDQAVPQGPLAGIVAGWHRLLQADRPDTVIVLSCDLPALTSDVVQSLLAASADHEHGALAHDGERPQPLIAAYHASALDRFEQCYAAGERSVRRCFVGWDLGSVAAQPRVLTDADTPQDLDGFDVHWPAK